MERQQITNISGISHLVSQLLCIQILFLSSNLHALYCVFVQVKDDDDDVELVAFPECVVASS
jgi:hypothetical protein